MREYDELLENLDTLIEQDVKTMKDNLEHLDQIKEIYGVTKSSAPNVVVRVIQNIAGWLMRKLYAPVLARQSEVNSVLMGITMDLERMQKHMEERAVVKMQIGTLGEVVDAESESPVIEYRKDYFRESNRLLLEERIKKHILYQGDRERKAIVQIVATMNFGDAVGNDAIAIKNMLKKRGVPTAIFAATIHPRVSDDDIIPLKYIPELKQEDVVIYHFAAADINIRILHSLQCKKVLRYHNITPPYFFEPYDETATKATSIGLEQIKENRKTFDYGIIDSEYNVNDLRAMDYCCPLEVTPILIPFKDYAQEPDENIIEKYRDGKTNVLFVGRGAPNKKIEDVIYAFKEYKQEYDKDARLFLVGNYDQNGLYTKYINEIIENEQVEDVIFPGHISFASILAYYKIADVFLCMSEHEGFCVPLVEAMYFDVPIIAFSACAVPETLGGAGILVEEKNWKQIAAYINKIVKDKDFADEIIQLQKRRLLDFSEKEIEKKFNELLDNV